MFLGNFFIKKSVLQKKLFNSTTPQLWHNDWFTLKGKKCLMICHDHEIDRRILLQAASLDKIGVKTLIVCLSRDIEDALEMHNGIFIHRIGLQRIVPDCPIFWQFYRMQLAISSLVLISNKFCKVLHRLNVLFYKVASRLLYRCKLINHPLPFDECFYRAGYLYKSDIIIAHDLPALTAAERIASRRKIPLVYDAHELYSEQKVFSNYQKKLLYKVEAKNIKKCDKVFTVCEPLAKIMGKRYNITQPSVILNAVPYYAPHNNKSISDLINIPRGNDAYILFQGGVFKNRNIENLVKGFLLLSEYPIKLIFLGPKDEKFVNDLKKIIGDELDKKVFFIDPVSQDYLLDITSTVTFGVIPYIPHDLNTKYCSPNKLFEFIQAEIPFLYHQDLLEVTRIAKELQASLAADLSTPIGVKNGLEKMLKRDLTIDKENLKKQKHLFCWENEEKKFLIYILDILGSEINITNLARLSNSTLSIKGFEFDRILTEDAAFFYAAANESEALPHYIIFDFSTPVRLKKINIIWESAINYASKYSIEYFDEIQKKFIELIQCKNILGVNHSLSINSKIYLSRIRLMVYETAGQKRLLIRNFRFFGYAAL